jgi:hypothetical protein
MKGTGVTIMLGLIIVMFVRMSIASAAYDSIIYQAQKRLQELGYTPGQLDGVWGEKTERAVKEFQRDNNLLVTGDLDEQTKEKMSLKKDMDKKSIASQKYEEKAWKQVNLLDKESIKIFLYKFPSGAHSEEAKFGLQLQEEIEKIKTKEKIPKLIIPFRSFLSSWEDWRKKNPRTQTMGLFAEKTGATGLFLSLGGGKTVHSQIIVSIIPETGKMKTEIEFPTGDGSIYAIRTDGTRFDYIGDVVYETPPGERLFFAVIEGLGVVYLHGKGTVILPDGKIIQFD